MMGADHLMTRWAFCALNKESPKTIRGERREGFSYCKGGKRTIVLRNISLLFNSSYSKIKISGSTAYSEIFSGIFDLSYNSKLLSLSTNYYLNYDLLGNQMHSQPQIWIGLNPIPLYGELISASFRNIFIYNILVQNDLRDNKYSNNLVFNLYSQSIYLYKSRNLDFNIALEQFLEKEGRNFTSIGFIVNVQKELFKGILLEGHYSIQSRRKTENGLIEGTTSQNLSMIFRANPNDGRTAGYPFLMIQKMGNFVNHLRILPSYFPGNGNPIHFSTMIFCRKG
jgi:hypothetical protein